MVVAILSFLSDWVIPLLFLALVALFMSAILRTGRRAW